MNNKVLGVMKVVGDFIIIVNQVNFVLVNVDLVVVKMLSVVIQMCVGVQVIIGVV